MEQGRDEDLTLMKEKEWRLLYKLGGIAAIIAAILYLFELLFIRWSIYPNNIEEWYTLFGRSILLGLFYLNTLDIIVVGFLGVTIIALCVRLKTVNKSITTIALPFAFLGIGMFIIPRTLLLSLVSLSNEYNSLVNPANASMVIAAGKAINTLCVPTMQTTGFFIMAATTFLLSIVMLNSNRMPKIAGFIGIMAFLLLIAENICVVFAPSLAVPLLVVTGAFWVVWWLFVGVGLLMAKD